MSEEDDNDELDNDELDNDELDNEDEYTEDAFHSVEPISYFGTDFDVHGLVRRLNSGDIVVPTFDPSGAEETDLKGFQRKFVWKRLQMDRFVESLLLGFPVPGIFLVQQPDRKLLVLDGQQRLKTLRSFYENSFKLESVSDDLKGLSYLSLDDQTRRALDNTFIHATVIRYDEGAGGDDSVYQLFERLNTGGTNLYPHEIRVALYNGRLVELIRRLNRNSDWRALYGTVSQRLKDHELILRFLALYYESERYERPLRGFLNHFLKRHRELEGLEEKSVRSLFENTCAAVNAGIGKRAFRLKRGVNAALVDAVMVGVARRITKSDFSDHSSLGHAFDELLGDEKFITAIGRATADEDRVRMRLEKATKAFAGV